MDELALVLEAVASTASRKRKVGHLAAWFARLSDADLLRALAFLTGQGVGKQGSGKKMSIGYATLREAAVRATGWDAAMVRLCHREVGDSGEAISLLLRPVAQGEPFSLEQAEQAYRDIFARRTTEAKVGALVEAWVRMKPLTAKYFIKGITGNFRVGLQTKLVEEALAEACQVDLAALRAAVNRAGEISTVALAARMGQLAEVKASLFHPLEFMLAKPLDGVADLEPGAAYWVEDKYDGIRSQVHFDAGKVKIYSRGMEEVTAAFPEVVEALVALPGSGVLDGEILAWREGRALNFNLLQQRLARKKVEAELRERIPVVFMAYDLLYSAGRLWLNETVEARRTALEAMLDKAGGRLLISPQDRLRNAEEIEERFAAARARGNEGLMLKRAGSVYEAGKRSATWWKVKRPYGTLDVVVTAAEQGSGRRATMLSDYTFAVREGERFLNVGKAYSGLTDEEIRTLTRHFRAIALEKYGRVTVVRPEVVLEVAFDGVQKSPRHKSGYALRFPRILRWRQDKRAEEADSLERVKELYAATLAD